MRNKFLQTSALILGFCFFLGASAEGKVVECLCQCKGLDGFAVMATWSINEGMTEWRANQACTGESGDPLNCPGECLSACGVENKWKCEVKS